MLRSIIVSLAATLIAGPAAAQSSGQPAPAASRSGSSTDGQLAAPDVATTSTTGKTGNGHADAAKPGTQLTVGNKDIKITPSGQVEAPNP